MQAITSKNAKEKEINKRINVPHSRDGEDLALAIVI